MPPSTSEVPAAGGRSLAWRGLAHEGSPGSAAYSYHHMMDPARRGKCWVTGRCFHCFHSFNGPVGLKPVDGVDPPVQRSRSLLAGGVYRVRCGREADAALTPTSLINTCALCSPLPEVDCLATTECAILTDSSIGSGQSH